MDGNDTLENKILNLANKLIIYIGKFDHLIFLLFTPFLRLSQKMNIFEKPTKIL
jgi:hypothetical protein